MRQNLKDYGVTCDKVPLYYDNESLIKISNNSFQHCKMKHIEIHHHFIREHIKCGEIDLIHLNTNEQLAYIFTKPLDEARFRELRHELNIIDSSNVVWLITHPTTLIILSCLGVGMDIGGVLFSQWTLPSLIMHKLIKSFTLTIFMVLVLQRRVLVMDPRLKSSRCHTNWLKHRWPRPSPPPSEACAFGELISMLCHSMLAHL